MEENIKILEERIKSIKNYDTYRYDYTETDIEMIENLIKAYKELEEENEELKEKLEKASNQLDLDYVDNNFISKSLMKEKIEEIDEEKLNYSEDEWYLESEIKGYATEKLQELLGEEK